MTNRRIFAVALVVSLACAAGVWWWSRGPFESSGLVAAWPALLPESVLPSDSVTNRDINQAAQKALSRAGLTNAVTTFDLYPFDRARLPLEDVIENMRKDVRITRFRDNFDAWRVTFSYADDPVIAQKVTAHVLGRLVEEVNVLKVVQLRTGIVFLNDRIGELEKAQSPDRRQIELLRVQLAQMDLRLKLQEGNTGARLEMLDPASLPAGNWAKDFAPLSIAAGGMGGFLATAGVLHGFLWRRQRRRLLQAVTLGA